MKRDGYGGDDGPAMKRPRNPDDEASFLIPSRVAGSIIGKSGQNISNLRKEYKASITVPDCPGPERVLSICSPDVETVLDVVRAVLPNLADVGGPPGGHNKGGDELDVRLLIHQSRAGCVIGKAGAKIKELREQTGAKLKIFSNPAPQSTERVVQLVGNADSVIAGVREVLDLTRQVPIKGPVMAYDPHNYDDFYSDEYGGFGGGGGGGGAPRGRPQGGGGGPRGMPGRRGPGGPGPRGPPPNMARNGPPGPRGFNDFGGPPPLGKFNGPPPGAFGGGYGGGDFGGDYGGDFGGGFQSRPPPAQSFNPSMQGPDTSTQVTIPKDLAGAIIGKAGSRIRKIRQDSGSNIEIAEPLPGSDDRIITITGSPQSIQMAQYLLQQSVHENNPSMGRGGGNY